MVSVLDVLPPAMSVARGCGPRGDDRETAAGIPARAASTAALSARRLVWRAISSITPMMSEILRDDSSIRDIALTAWATTSPRDCRPRACHW